MSEQQQSVLEYFEPRNKEATETEAIDQHQFNDYVLSEVDRLDPLEFVNETEGDANEARQIWAQQQKE